MSGSITLHVEAFWRSPWDFSAFVCLREKGVPFHTSIAMTRPGVGLVDTMQERTLTGTAPVLQHDGLWLAESLAIIEYLEELNPTPPMIGTTPGARARVRELERIADLGVLGGVGQYFQNTHPFMAQRVKQSPEAAETAKTRLTTALRVLDAAIGSKPFVAGERPTIADCTLLAALEFAEFAQAPIDPECKNVARWHAKFKERPSAQA